MSTTVERPSWRRDPAALAAVGVPALGAVLTLGVTAHLTSWDLATESAGAVVFGLVVTVWSLLPFALAAVVGLSVRRHWRRGTPVALGGSLLLVVLSAAALWDVLTSESSTAVLALLFLPFLQGAWVGLTMAVAVGVAALRRRGAAS